eukprot:321610_1
MRWEVLLLILVSLTHLYRYSPGSIFNSTYSNSNHMHSNSNHMHSNSNESTNHTSNWCHYIQFLNMDEAVAFKTLALLLCFFYFNYISSNIITLLAYSIISLCIYICIRNNRHPRMSKMILLIPLFISTSYALQVDTLMSGGAQYNGNMFDICGVKEVEIQKMDINCETTGTAVIEIWIATGTNDYQGFSEINTNATFWTLVHSESVNCQSEGAFTVLNKFNQGIIVTLPPSNCRGFYVTRTTGNISYSNAGTVEGVVYVDNGDIQIKTGIAKAYPFGSGQFTPGVWNGRVHYSIKTQISCGSRWCYYIDLYPTIGDGYTDQVNLISTINGEETYFEMHYTIKNTHCVDPTITFTFYETDFNNPSSEWLEIYDDDDSLLQRCTASKQDACNSLFTCFTDKPLTAVSVDSIRLGHEYVITMKQSNDVHLVSCPWSTDAQLIIKCSGNTAQPTKAPSLAPSITPSLVPSLSPSLTPSIAPTQQPSIAPTQQPSLAPSMAPTQPPSIAPSNVPSIAPTQPPSIVPSIAPSIAPSMAPSITPSIAPTQPPSIAPSNVPSIAPTQPPSIVPSIAPSIAPSMAPSITPSIAPTQPPSIAPTQQPSIAPTSYPSLAPTQLPSTPPSITSSISPSIAPTQPPTIAPSVSPSISPSITPSISPTIAPTSPPTIA